MIWHWSACPWSRDCLATTSTADFQLDFAASTALLPALPSTFLPLIRSIFAAFSASADLG
jgi:hypothetical protein